MFKKKEYDWLDDPFNPRAEDARKGNVGCLVVAVSIVVAMVLLFVIAGQVFSTLAALSA